MWQQTTAVVAQYLISSTISIIIMITVFVLHFVDFVVRINHFLDFLVTAGLLEQVPLPLELLRVIILSGYTNRLSRSSWPLKTTRKTSTCRPCLRGRASRCSVRYFRLLLRSRLGASRASWVSGFITLYS